jgi:hypothetical protein
MIKLSWWEEFIIGAAVSFLTVISSKITNPTEASAVQTTLALLQRLLAGQVSTT